MGQQTLHTFFGISLESYALAAKVHHVQIKRNGNSAIHTAQKVKNPQNDDKVSEYYSS